MSKRPNSRKKKKKPNTSKSFDVLCRANGIPVRADYDTEIQYRKARRKAGLA